MTAPGHFDLVRTPIERGTTLIEASAGTGKTFTIAGLFLRLILEQDLAVRDILVVTFTEAATEELRGRIRDRLAEASVALGAFVVHGTLNADPMLSGLLEPHLPAAALMRVRLERALGAFDETPIFTIHGFCQRMLRDRAFESRALFDVELLKDDTRILREIAEDFWRRLCYPADAVTIHVLLGDGRSPESFLPLLRQRNRHPSLQVISPVDDTTPLERRAAMLQAFSVVASVWRERAAQIRLVFAQRPNWAKGDHAKPAIVATQWELLDACLDDARRTPESMEAVEFFSTAQLEQDTRANQAAPEDPFFDACDDFVRARTAFVTGLQLEFLAYAADELKRRKRERKLQSFDDLLTGLHDALNGPGGERLATEIRSRYHAALIDEFQDTDPVQCAIFRTLFQRPDRILFLIGDPKQAIYGFRGADIFTYLDAARGVDRAYTLGRNFRSESGLVHAVNTLFSAAPNPFLEEDIRFQPVTAGSRADAAPLTEGGQASPPLRLWFLSREENAKSIAKAEAEETILNCVAAEIARLLTGPARLGTEPVGPRDIAVLVPENRQARVMQETLRRWGIPSVLYTEESVFSSREASELQRVLEAIATPARDSAVRAALATELMGLDALTLDGLTRDEAAFHAWQERLDRLHEAWEKSGFTPMFRRWLQAFEIRARLLRFDDGERRLTNLLHLGEILHGAALERHLGLADLARWLAEQIQAGERESEEHQLRLERDDHAVKLVTIHKSKGLEYPIVFCPFSWRSSDLSNHGRPPIFFHRRAEAGDGAREATTFCCDLGTEALDQHRELAFAERLAEGLRLLYVALTRARNRCYFAWGAFKGAESSAAAWLLHPIATGPADATGAPDRLGEILQARWRRLTDDAMLDELRRLATQSELPGRGPTIEIGPAPIPESSSAYQPPDSTGPALEPRTFGTVIPRDWRILSFSGLTARARDEAPDRDAETSPVPDRPTRSDSEDGSAPAEGIFAFPRGTTAGTCLHKIFETVEFDSHTGPELAGIVEAQLAAHGLPPARHVGPVCDMVRRCLAVPLEPVRPGQPALTLSSIPRSDRLIELEFFFPVDHLNADVLQLALKSLAGASSRSHPGAVALDGPGWARTRGYLRGFVDLIFRHNDRFYIVDWKSNHLGNRVEDYGPAAIGRAMQEHHYHLQYLLYTVALHRYLRRRLRGYSYEQHFGGVRYLFVRGVDPARPEFGVHHDRPAAAVVDALSDALGTLPEVAP